MEARKRSCFVYAKDLWTFCFTFGITQDETKTNLYQELYPYKENMPAAYVAPSTEEHFRQADGRIDLVEVSVERMNTFVEKSLTAFRCLLTGASIEKMMRSFRVPADSTRKGAGTIGKFGN